MTSSIKEQKTMPATSCHSLGYEKSILLIIFISNAYGVNYIRLEKTNKLKAENLKDRHLSFSQATGSVYHGHGSSSALYFSKKGRFTE